MSSKGIGIIVLLASIAIALFGWSDLFELRFEEPRRAIVTWEMMHFQNPIQPTIQGWSYYNKPPFFNWVMAACCWLFDSYDEWAIRFPSLLSLLATIALVYGVGKKYIGKSAALCAGLFTITSSEIFFHSSIYAGEIDLFFLFLTLAQVLSIFVFQQRKQFLWMFICSYLLAACGVLTKGLPSIAFQGITLLAWLIACKEWKLLFSWKHFVGIFLFVGCLGAYFYAYSFYDDAFAFAANLFKEASQRTASESAVGKLLAGLMKFPLTVAFLLLPWLLVAIYTIRKGFWGIVKKNPFLYFSAIFIGANILLYWLSPGVRRRYLFMFLPFFYAIIAHFFIQFQAEKTKITKVLDGFWGFFMVLVSLAFLAFPFIPVTKDVSAVWLWSVLFSLMGGGLFYAYLKEKQQFTRLLLVIGIVVLARLGFNVIFMPGQAAKSDSMLYRKLTTELLAITKEEAIHFGDDIITIENELTIGPVSLGGYALKRPPFFHYQIPYYLSKSNHQVMQFDEELQPNVFYILPKEKAERHQMKVYKEFYPPKSGALWALAKKE